MLDQPTPSHDPDLRSWVDSANAPDTDFPIQNLPLGVFFVGDDGEDESDARVGVAIGSYILDLGVLAEEGLLDGVETNDDESDLGDDLNAPALGLLMMSGRERAWRLRKRISKLLAAGNDDLAGRKKLRNKSVISMDRAVMMLPDPSQDYTDFYASIHHATNVGSMFRPDNPLLPNYAWIPIGYHGRASTLVASGSAVRRPMGQTRPDESAPPEFGPCRQLDYEAEVGFFIAGGNQIGEPISIEDAESMVFGAALVNDWSARDIQKWEYQPLGPFLAKNFATTVSPWVVTMDALVPFRTPAFARPAGLPAPLPYLDSEANRARGGIDITIEVHLSTHAMRTKGIPPVRLSRGSYRDMMWTIAQMVTHHTSNGCALQAGDLLASGTVSGPARENRGCLLELTWDGDPWASSPRIAPGSARTPIELPTGEKRTFLQDGDEVILRGSCDRPGARRIGFGECRGVILPAES